MQKLQDFLTFVKSQADYHDRAADRFKRDPIRHDRHAGIAQKFRELAEYLEQNPLIESVEHGFTPGIPKPGVMRIGNLDELPPELRAQLNISESDQLESDIISVIDGFGGAANIDEILVGLWRKTKAVTERAFLSRKLYRMVQHEKLWSVPGRKGVYSTHKIWVEELEEDG